MQSSARAPATTIVLTGLDILVDIEPDTSFSLLNLIDVEHIIEDATGLQAQATVRRSISPRFAQRIVDDILEVF